MGALLAASPGAALSLLLGFSFGLLLGFRFGLGLGPRAGGAEVSCLVATDGVWRVIYTLTWPRLRELGPPGASSVAFSPQSSAE